MKYLRAPVKRLPSALVLPMPLLLPLLLAPLLLNSCFGVYADISVRADGSGTIALEYRVSHLAASLGSLDGNERWHTVPVGRADFERSLARLPGLRLASFSEKSAGEDNVIHAAIDFKTLEALTAFLDGGGGQARSTRENGTNRLTLIMLDAETGRAANANPDLSALVRSVCAPYETRIRFTAPRSASLTLLNGAGLPSGSLQAARIAPRGKTVSLSIGTGDLLFLPEGLGIELRW
jgi:hypothetical protein